MERNIRISDYDYPLPEGRIAKFPLERREQSKLLVCRDGRIAEDRFERIGRFLPEGSMLVFNNTKVIRARLISTRRPARASKYSVSSRTSPPITSAPLPRTTAAAGNASSAI